MEFDYKNILENKQYLEVEKEIPVDIKEYINDMEKVKRFNFKEYPKNMIIDDTKNHTLKLVYLTRLLDLNIDNEKIIRTLWIHDIPELITDDITVVEKYRKEELFNKFEQMEKEAAQKLLNTYDQNLLENFNNANRFLKDKNENKEMNVSIEFLIAKILDNSEGNMTFHWNVSNWVKSKKYDLNKLPPVDSLKHTFITNDMFTRIIKDTKSLSKNEKHILITIINTVLKNIISFWNKIPSNNIPNCIKDFINKYEKHQ